MIDLNITISRKAAGFSSMAVMISASLALAAETTKFHVDPVAGEVLNQYRIDCHEDGTREGDVRLNNLAELSLAAQLDMMNRMLEKVHFEEMPPKKKD